MKLPWRRGERRVGQEADFAQVEAAVARMREALVPLNEQLHGLATHISTMRAALTARGRSDLPAASATSLEAALAAAEASYEHSLRTRDAVLRQAEELQAKALGIRATLGSLASRDACAEAALQAEDRVRRELDSLAHATARLEARLELDEGA
jgi:hypothetical protein